MVTFDQARQIVYEAESGQWAPNYNFNVPPYGWETDDYWFVLADIEPDDRGGAIPGSDPIRHVNKLTGQYGRGTLQINGRPAWVERKAGGLCIEVAYELELSLMERPALNIALNRVGDWSQDPDAD